MVAPTGMVGTQTYIVGAGIARPFFTVFACALAFPFEEKVSDESWRMRCYSNFIWLFTMSGISAASLKTIGYIWPNTQNSAFKEK